ncbi:peptidoglycan-binding domain-containing protein [Streptomyces ficellus]|uniref:Peptidoglycan-binding protein n=1 Tax=Streptomyces ficellus TaxID=1977088 RepID=A0A6I6FHQ9_9ACTN|nr:peptidoglycan-binding domain-containing protein [Streptomyces ficellus]QGV77008.1 peptidoglycan-binding protein [Streptomyces ficellus]
MSPAAWTAAEEMRNNGPQHSSGETRSRTAGRGRARSGARRRRKRTGRLPLTAAVAALLCSAAFAGGFWMVKGTDPRAADERPSTALVEDPDGPATSTPAGDAGAPPAGVPDPGSPSHVRGLARQPHPSSGAASASPSATGTGTPTATSSPGTPSASAAPSTAPAGPTLSRHDRGPEVTELQQRFTHLGLWHHPVRDHYNQHLQNTVARFQETHGIQEDPTGVYGPATRRVLESMTP